MWIDGPKRDRKGDPVSGNQGPPACSATCPLSAIYFTTYSHLNKDLFSESQTNRLAVSARQSTTKWAGRRIACKSVPSCALRSLGMDVTEESNIHCDCDHGSLRCQRAGGCRADGPACAFVEILGTQPLRILFSTPTPPSPHHIVVIIGGHHGASKVVRRNRAGCASELPSPCMPVRKGSTYRYPAGLRPSCHQSPITTHGWLYYRRLQCPGVWV